MKEEVIIVHYFSGLWRLLVSHCNQWAILLTTVASDRQSLQTAYDSQTDSDRVRVHSSSVYVWLAMTGLQQHWQLTGTAISSEKSNALDAEGLTLAALLMANHPQLILPTCLLPNIMNYTLVFLMTLWI